MTIDYVVSYIDYTQPEIQELYEKVVGKKYENDLNNTYFDFSLVLKLILKNLSFINKLYIVCKDVQVFTDNIQNVINESNGKIIRVNESEILPGNFMTFSSACIEMFIWKIPNLSEYFLYACDDMIPLLEVKESDFYENNIPFIKFFHFDFLKLTCLYDLHGINTTNLIFNKSQEHDNYQEVYRTDHTIRPLTKSICKECYEKYENFILGSLSKVRFYNNLNMDLYMLYGLKHNLLYDKKLSYSFMYINVTNISFLDYLILNTSKKLNNAIYQIVCFNDVIHSSENVTIIKTKINQILQNLL